MTIFTERLVSPFAVHFLREPDWTSPVQGYDLETLVSSFETTPGVGKYDVILSTPFPPIEVVRLNETWCALGTSSRRLHCLQRAAARQWPRSVAARVEVFHCDQSTCAIHSVLSPHDAKCASDSWPGEIWTGLKNNAEGAQDGSDRAVELVHQDERFATSELSEAPFLSRAHSGPERRVSDVVLDAQRLVSDNSEHSTPPPPQAGLSEVPGEKKSSSGSDTETSTPSGTHRPRPSLKKALARAKVMPSPKMLSLPRPPRGLQMPSSASPMNIYLLSPTAGSPSASPCRSSRWRTPVSSDSEETDVWQNRAPTGVDVPVAEASQTFVDMSPNRRRLESQRDGTREGCFSANQVLCGQSHPRSEESQWQVGQQPQSQAHGASEQWQSDAWHNGHHAEMWQGKHAAFQEQADKWWYGYSNGLVGKGHRLEDLIEEPDSVDVRPVASLMIAVDTLVSGSWSGPEGEIYSCQRVGERAWSCVRDRSQCTIELDDMDQKLFCWNRTFWCDFDDLREADVEVQLHWKPVASHSGRDITWVKIDRCERDADIAFQRRRKGVGTKGKGTSKGGKHRRGGCSSWRPLR